MTVDARIAVKAFILNHQNQLLLLKRRPNDPHKPGVWDIPGGRLDLGEDPYLGLQREVTEETGLTIDIVAPLEVHHFTRDDGQIITMLIFLCQTTGQLAPVLSAEHTDHRWHDPDQIEGIPAWLHGPVRSHQQFFANHPRFSQSNQSLA